MSSGTGKATSQKSGIDWKDNLERITPSPSVIPSGARDPGVCQKRQHSCHRQEPRSLALLEMTAACSATPQLFSEARFQDTSSPSAGPSTPRLSGVGRAAGMRDDR